MCQKTHMLICFSINLSKTEIQKPCALKDTPAVQSYCLCSSFTPSTRGIAQQLWWERMCRSWREIHLRLCNALWKMHNFYALTSELCSSTLFKLWANWAIRVVLYSEIVFTGQTGKTSHISVDKREEKHCATGLSNTRAEAWIQILFRGNIHYCTVQQESLHNNASYSTTNCGLKRYRTDSMSPTYFPFYVTTMCNIKFIEMQLYSATTTEVLQVRALVADCCINSE